MPKPVISVEHLTKKYDLGVIGTGTISRDLNRWWARLRGQPDPYTRIGQRDAFERIGESILALDDVSFTVEQGEALGIIGRNGAGKSTLLKILSRVTAPTSGVVKVKGRIGSLLEVGTGFHPELTGRENIYLNGAILGMKKAEVTHKFDEIVDFAGVEKFIDTPVKRYSSGMYVRLAFAVSAHLESEILIVDEVLAVGDTEFQKKCLGKMGDVANKEGRTILFVSHNMSSINNLCSGGIHLQDGKISFIGTAEETIKVYYESIGNKKNATVLEDYRTSKESSILKNVIVAGAKQGELPRIDIGNDLCISLYFAPHNNIPQINIGIGINNELGERVATLLSKIQNKAITLSGKEKRVDCTIKNINLIPGVYSLKFAIGDHFHDFDVIESYPGFEINPSDYFGTGKLPSRSQGYLIMDASWQEE